MKNLLLSIFLFFTFYCDAQIISYTSEHINVKTYNTELQQYNEWSGWHYSDVIITISENKLHIYSEVDQEYTIVSVIEKGYLPNGERVTMDAIDINGSRVTLEFVNCINEERYIYIRWTNLQLAYKIRKL